MRLDKKAHDKFVIGDGITDEELSCLLVFYYELVESLEELDQDFYLAKREAQHRLNVLNSFNFSRNANG